VISLFCYPIQISFNILVDSSLLSSLQDSYQALCLLDILFHFNTGFWEFGTIVESRSRILTNYLKGFFFIDLLCFISISHSWADIGLGWINYGILLKFFSLSQIFSLLNNKYRWREKIGEIMDFLTIFYLLLSIINVFACIWHQAAAGCPETMNS